MYLALMMYASSVKLQHAPLLSSTRYTLLDKKKYLTARFEVSQRIATTDQIDMTL
jgi:hypothetical protein